MYLISIYFDENTEQRLQHIMKSVAKETGNTFMLDNHVPPHITVTAVETKQEDLLLTCVEEVVKKLEIGDIKFVSVGTFSSQVIFVQPVLSEYLHMLTECLTQECEKMGETICSPYYQPFHWLPHCTVGKQMTKEQMLQAFEVLQKQFVPMDGKVVRIGVAKTNPHRDIRVWELEGDILYANKVDKR